MIRFGCPNCKMVLQAADNQAGLLLSCPKCKTQMKVPNPVPSVPQPATPASTIPPASVLKVTPPVPQPSAAQLASSVAPPVHRDSEPAVPRWKRALGEVREIGIATWDQAARLVKYGRSLWRNRTLGRTALNTQLALGDRMYRVGSGDPQVRSQIAGMDEKIRQAEARKESARALNSEREKLLLQLAAAALGQSVPPPGAEAECAKAKEAQEAMQRHVEATARARAALPPKDRRARGRVLIGIGTVGGLCLLAFCLLCGGMASFLGFRGSGGSGTIGSDGRSGPRSVGTPGTVAKASVSDVLTEDMEVEDLIRKMGPPHWSWKHPHGPEKMQKYAWKLANGRYDVVDVFQGKVTTYQNLNEVQFINVRRSNENWRR